VSGRVRRPVIVLGVALITAALAVAAGSAVYWAGHAGEAPRAGSPSAPVSPVPTGTTLPADGKLPSDTILAWTVGGLPPGFADAVRRLPGVAHVVVVSSGTAQLSRTLAPGGAVVSKPPTGMFIPVEVASADPAALAPFWPASLRPDLTALAHGQALLGMTSAAIRRLGLGGRLVFAPPNGRAPAPPLRVGGVVPDAAVGAAEVFVGPRVAGALGVTRPRYLLVDPRDTVPAARVERAIRSVLPPGALLRLRTRSQTPFLRQGDAVLAPVMVKKLFGEFAADPTANAGGWFTMSPAWVRRHIVTAAVPILGHVTGNRRIVPQLRAALEEVQARGLATLIDPGDYGGCYTPRLLSAADPSAGPGHHAWGIAIDINVSRNPFGGRPTQDPRIVAIFRRWGFTWGGRWLFPDGMHFEAIRVVAVPSGG
jgi:hypothetical protein